MIRRLSAGAALVAAAAAAVVLTSQPAMSNPGSPTAPAAKLPIRKVVLFSAGVGYFQREAEIDGNAKIDLSFPGAAINDLLKSLTLQDLGNGQIAPVSYDSHDPVERTLRSFAINLADNPTQSGILKQARGEPVEVVLQQTSAPLTGSIVGVERQKIANGANGFIDVDVLNLLCADGLRSIRLTEVQRLRFLNPALEGELRRALETLTQSRDSQKKTVTLQFTGAGKRPVVVSYVAESPIWKTSYRLVLDRDGKPFLQGWAMVENPSDEDWTDVRMALVSGRPISFQMDLYQPLYVPRPKVEPELFASLRPQTYDGRMDKLADDRAKAAAAPKPAMAPSASESGIAGGRGGDVQRRSRFAGKEVEAATPSAGTFSSFNADGAQGIAEPGIDLSRGVASAASGANLGDAFQYTINQPVTIPRQKSAMLPIVNREVDGSRVSIYNQRVHAKYPLLGLRFKNNSGESLMQGPVTVYDGPSYAGDARLPDLQANEERLISYAIDLGTEVEVKPAPANGQLTAVKIDHGILIATTKIREEVAYHAVNRSGVDRVLLIEHPYRPEYRLVSDAKPAERARDLYRFEIKLPAGANGATTVTEERDIRQSVGLTNIDGNQVRFYLNQTVLSPAVRKALERAVELQRLWTAADAESRKIDQQLQQINEDQQRLRSNLERMPKDAAAYRRYLDKFDVQETEIEKLQTRRTKLAEVEQQHRAAYEAFLSNLTVE